MLVGHQKQWQFLKKSAELGKLSHAYLFYGQEKLGKKTTALEFIKWLNCENLKKRPCQICRSCQDIQKKQYPDLFFIEPQKKEIQISQIRKLNKDLSLKSYSSFFKTAVIDEAHLMNQEAQNCFLKTLEEPRGDTILILVSEFPEMLFPTIISRIQKIKFYPVKKEEINNYLRQRKLPEKKLKEIEEFCVGKPGEIIEILSDFQKIDFQKKTVKDLHSLVCSDLATRFKYAKDLSQDQQKTKEVLDIWLHYFRKALIRKTESNLDKNSLNKLKDVLETVQRINYLISTTNINSKLALEILMLEL